MGRFSRAVRACGVRRTGAVMRAGLEKYTQLWGKHRSSQRPRRLDKHAACLPWSPEWLAVCLSLIHGQRLPMCTDF